MNEYIIKLVRNYTVVSIFGGALYCVMELLWRGRTHPSMALCGGICFAMIYLVNDRLRGSSFLKQAMICCIFITTLELIFGFVCNIVLGLDVWDYSMLKYNLLGQICVAFSIIWYLLSMPALIICRIFKKCLQ